MMKNLKLHFSLLVIVTITSFPSLAASFKCQQASQPDEKTVCADQVLSEKDVQMATTYGLLKELLLMGARGAVEDEQREWLSRRKKCGAVFSCLSRLYDERNEELKSQFQSVSKSMNAG